MELLRDKLQIEKLQLDKIIINAFGNNLPIVLWRRPLDDNYKLAISFDSDTNVKEISLENLDSGFLFCPFEVNAYHNNHFVKNDLVIEFNGNKCQGLTVSPRVNSEKVSSFINESNKIDSVANIYSRFRTGEPIHADLDYIKLVEKSVSEINRGTFSKVVPSRFKTIALNKGFNPIDFFKKLEASYPNAFIYLISLPDTDTWIGATPENIISIEDNKIFKTTALAGTQKYDEGMDLADAAWRQKEIEEQAMVSRYIINCFKKIRLREFEEIGPKTIKAGNLIHLRTDYIVNMEEVNFPQLGTVMLDLLHPTSAVCGMPKDTSLKFIHENEGFDRSYFSGFLGPVNTNRNTSLFVNLRCMRLNRDFTADVFAGAGVTSDSKPEKEWAETELKMETLMKLV